MEFDLGGTAPPLVAWMPQVMRFRYAAVRRYPEILPMLEAWSANRSEERAGYAGILARLAWMWCRPSSCPCWAEWGGCGDATGWVQALRDPRLGRAIVAMHRDPGREWTVAELAAQMGSPGPYSRSVSWP